MYIYVPDSLPEIPPILVVCHYCGGSAAGVFGEAYGGGIVSAADQYGFIMVFPQAVDNTGTNGRCWDAGSTNSLTRYGGGDTQAIVEMVKYAITNYQANGNRVYVTGTSSGAMMTEALLAVYPDIFKAGAEFSGVPAGGWAVDDPNGEWSGPCAAGQVTNTPQGWGAIVGAMDPSYSGPRPRIQLWHGTADSIISYTNQLEAIKEWTDVLGLSLTPASTATVTLPNITNKWTHEIWQDSCGNTVLDAWSEINGPHGTDANFDAQYVIPFLGLDEQGPVDPDNPVVSCGHTQRGRPHLNAARTTFVADDGQPLRGPFTSTEWTSATTDIPMIKSLGFNAVHLYAEDFDPNYPNAGSTAPGYSVSNIDEIVSETATNGLYLIITIGNGGNNGSYNLAWATNFWNLYAPRYANQTHVLYEIHNEPVAWGPPYSATNATPPGAINLEADCYKIIRANAPNTPALLFTYAVFGGTGGTAAALTDIQAFNTNVFGNANAVWTNEAVAFHGYAGWQQTAIAASNLLSAGYSGVMTEELGTLWGTDTGVLDAELISALERLDVSWITFEYIPPTGVSVDVTQPQYYADIVNWAGLSWNPDYGDWPPARGTYDNNGLPWTTQDFTNNVLSGTLHIEAENFDTGGQGVAYYVTNTANAAVYRTNETVDIETTTDTGGGYDVTGMVAGDWLEYTIFVSEPGLYNLKLRVAGAAAGSVQVLAGGINGTNLTGAWTVPNTGGGQVWATITNTVFLTPGQQVLHLNILAGGFNLNWLELSPVANGLLANGTYKFLNAANALALTGVTSDGSVTPASYSGSTYQQWNVQHIGADEYEMTSANDGWSWDSFGGGLGFVWWWGAGGDQCYLIRPTSGGYYSVLTVGGGLALAITAASTNIDQEVYSGSANQQWAIESPSALAFPTGLSAVAVSWTQISLIWNSVAGATGYNVKRATTSGGPYTTIASGVTATNYLDSGLALGTTYYYVVSAMVSTNETLNSTQASAATFSLFAFSWGSPVSFAGLNADQILTNFPGTKIAGAVFAQNGGHPITVTPSSGSPIVFAPANTSWASLAGGNGYTTGAWSYSTTNANFDSCLNAFYYDGAMHVITLSGLVVGQQYSVQLFALDDRSLSPAGSARTVDWQNPADSISVSAAYSMAANDYVVGTFTASNTVETIQENMLNSGYGNFNCLVLRAVGWNPPPYFTVEPGNAENYLGGSASLFGGAAGDSTIPNPTIAYQWAAGPAGGPYTNLVGGSKYSGTTTTNLTVNNLTTNDAAVVYVLIASNGGGATTSSPASLTAVTPSPVTLLGHWLAGAANFSETSGYSPAGTFDGFAVANGSHYFTNDMPPNATGVSLYLNNSGIGISNTCLAWDSDYTNTFDNNITNSFTVMCWAKGWPGGWNPWVSKYGESEAGWQLRTDGSDSIYPCWTIRNNGVGTVTLGVAVYGDPDDMASRSIAIGNDGKWHHYAGTFDAGLGVRYLYVDGVLAAAETGNVPYVMAATNRLMLGAKDSGSSSSSAGGYGNYFTGNLYDVRIYNDGLASQAQIRSIAALTPPSPTNRLVSGNQVVVTWSWGTLLQATNLLGPWTAVQAASPYTNSLTAPQQFFRVSNP
jgi:poly(hydroxyalkanoate) depolymerase family esterase